MARNTNSAAACAWFNAEIVRIQAAAKRRNAAVVYVDKRPFFTAFTHSDAFKLMRAVQNKGHHAVYRPL